jgi:hypothetical protein
MKQAVDYQERRQFRRARNNRISSSKYQTYTFPPRAGAALPVSYEIPLGL